MILFGVCPKYQVPYQNRDPERDQNFDKHPKWGSCTSDPLYP